MLLQSPHYTNWNQLVRDLGCNFRHQICKELVRQTLLWGQPAQGHPDAPWCCDSVESGISASHTLRSSIEIERQSEWVSVNDSEVSMETKWKQTVNQLHGCIIDVPRRQNIRQMTWVVKQHVVNPCTARLNTIFHATNDSARHTKPTPTYGCFFLANW